MRVTRAILFLFFSVLLSTGSAFAQAQQLLYSTYLGGSQTGNSPSLAIGADGSAYTAFAEHRTTDDASDLNVRVMKFEASTRAVAYSVIIAGAKDDVPASIALAADGSVWVTGRSASSDFPLINPIQSGEVGNANAFLFRLSPGGALTFSTLFATIGSDSWATQVVVDLDGSAVFVGGTIANVPTTPGVFQPTRRGFGEAFIARVSDAGTLLAATYLGGNGHDFLEAVAFGPDRDIYVGGSTVSDDLLVSPGAFQPTGGSRSCLNHLSSPIPCSDGFVGRFSPDLTQRRYLTYLRDTDPSTTNRVTFDYINAIAVGPTGDAYVTGFTNSGNLFPTTPGAFRTTCLACSATPQPADRSAGDVFVTRLNPTGTALVYSTFLGGASDRQVANDIVVDGTGRAFVGGDTLAADFPIVKGFQTTRQGGRDGFLSRLNASGSALDYSTYLGGKLAGGVESIFGVALGAGTTVWLSGITASSDFPTTPDAWQPGYEDFSEPFLTALSLPEALISIDIPGAGNVTAPFEIGGWALDRGAATDSGVDAVHVYAYGDLGGITFLGASPLGFARPDVAAAYGAQFANAGWLMRVDALQAGSYTLVAFAHSQLTGSFDARALRHITVVVDSRPLMSIDSPAPGSVVPSGTRVFVGGWAIDQGASSGPGIDAVHVWVYPNGGAGTPFFAGAANYGVGRADVGAVYGARFTNSGYELDVNGLAPGTYIVVAFAHSTVTNSFVVMQTRAVTISQ